MLNKAIERSADPPGWYCHLISVHEYLEGNYTAALAAAEPSARSGSAIGLSLTGISHAKLGNMQAATDDLAAAYRSFQATDQIVEALLEGLRRTGWTPPDKGSP